MSDAATRLEKMAGNVEGIYVTAVHSELTLAVLINTLKSAGVLTDEQIFAMNREAAQVALKASQEVQLPDDMRRLLVQVHDLFSSDSLD